MFTEEPFTQVETGHYRVHLSAQERRLLRELPAELMKQLESGDDDGSIYRLFPPGYTEDLGRQIEYDGLMRDDLQSSHVQALRLMQDSADTEELDAHGLSAWTRAINQLRLVLGTRLDITEELDEDDFSPTDPRIASLTLYIFLSRLLEAAIDALGDPEVTI